MFCFIETTGEFLDSWLQLLEKMVNPKTILESPHVLQTKMAQVNKQYEPMKYLARAHRLDLFKFNIISMMLIHLLNLGWRLK